MPSELIGTAGLWIALLVAGGIALSRRQQPETFADSAVTALLVLALQCLHFAEENATGFYRLFPERLELRPWGQDFFVWFNAIWLALWLCAIWAARRGRVLTGAAIALWFLAISAIANGIAHPALALLARGYFPGLWTSPFLGVAGFILARRLARP